MIAVDTNLLVYAHRPETPFHVSAKSVLTSACCQHHGVRELWTADRDFSRFPGVAVFNPLLADTVHDAGPSYGAHRRARAAGRREGLRHRREATSP